MARAGSGGVMSPGKAFFLLSIPVVAAGLLALFFVGRDETPGPSTNTRPVDGFALTDTEAIAKFEELNALRLRALRERDPSLLSLAFTPDSPAANKVSTSIRNLTRDGVFVRPGEETLNLSVLSNTTQQIHLQEVVVIQPTFVDASGDDVTVEHLRERWTVEWTLLSTGDEWLIHDSVVTSAKPLKDTADP